MCVLGVRHAIGFGNVLLEQIAAVIDDKKHFTDAQVFFGNLVHMDEIAQSPAKADETVVVAQGLFRVFHHDARQVVAMARGEAGQRAGKAWGIEKCAIELRPENDDFAHRIFRQSSEKIADFSAFPDDPARGRRFVLGRRVFCRIHAWVNIQLVSG